MSDYRIALAGNPNTGKSTLFNTLTGLKQHTGNWAGKTVVRAEGNFDYNDASFKIIDLPGTYSLFSNSADEEVARDYIIFDKPDVTIVVLDATSIERNMNLALQVLEMTSNVVVCVNLIDEADRLGIQIDTDTLAKRLGVPVVKISARKKKGINELLKAIHAIASGAFVPKPRQITYSDEIERMVQQLQPEVEKLFGNEYPSRWIALRIIEGDDSIWNAMKQHTKVAQGRKESINYDQSSSTQVV